MDWSPSPYFGGVIVMLPDWQHGSHAVSLI
jgi:hypothetical protein